MGGGGGGLERILEELQRELAGLKRSVATISRHHGIIEPLATEDSEPRRGPPPAKEDSELSRGGAPRDPARRRVSNGNNVAFASELGSPAARAGSGGSGTGIPSRGILSKNTSTASSKAVGMLIRAPSMKRGASLSRPAQLLLSDNDAPARRPSLTNYGNAPAARRPSLTNYGDPASTGPMRRASVAAKAVPVRKPPSVAFSPRNTNDDLSDEEGVPVVRTQPRPPRAVPQAPLEPPLGPSAALRDSAKDDSGSGSGSTAADAAVSSVTHALRLLSADYDRALQQRHQLQAMPKQRAALVQRPKEQEQLQLPAPCTPLEPVAAALPPVENVDIERGSTRPVDSDSD